jgi:PAS domain S-box-containing protein
MSPDLFCIVSREGKFLKLNPAWETILGYTIPEIQGKSFITFLHPDDVEPTKTQVAGQLTGTETIGFVNRYRAKDGSYRWLEWKARYDESSRKIYAVARDITENKINRDLLRQSEDILHAITNSIRDAIIMLDQRGNITFWNEASTAILGYQKEEVIGKNLHDLLTPARYQESFKRAYPHYQLTGNGEAVGKTLEMFAVHKNGYEFPVELSLSAIKADAGWQSVGILRDITEKQKIADSLRKSEARFRSYFELPLVGITMTSTEMGWIEVNEELLSMLGYSREELKKLTWADITHPDDVQLDVAHFNQMLAGEIEKYSLEKRFIRKSGEVIWVFLSVGCVRKPDGSLDYAVALLRDITKRKIAEEELHKLSLAVEQSPVSIVITDTQGNITYANPKAFETTGYTFEEIKGKNPRILKSGETPSTEYKALWDTISSGHQWQGLFHNKKKNGELYWESSSISPILDSSGKITHYVAVKEDITKRKLAEDELKESELKLKIASTTKDKLFSIIAHDLRGPIGNFIPILEVLTGTDFDLTDEEKIKLLEELKKATTTTFGLLDNLLNWSASQSGAITFQPLPHIINDCIRNNVELMSHVAHQKSIELRVDLPGELPIYADLNSIDLIIRNLLSNAIKFSHVGGVVTISARDDGKFIEVEVADQGVGIKGDVGKKLFHSGTFHSTKGTGKEKGSGLGLVLCKDFVERNGGRIWVESQAGEGSRFHFTIPKKA